MIRIWRREDNGDRTSLVCPSPLLELARSQPAGKDGWARIESPPSQRELGVLVGATRESVNKNLRFLTESGIVTRRGSQLMVATERLRALDRPDRLKGGQLLRARFSQLGAPAICLQQVAHEVGRCDQNAATSTADRKSVPGHSID